jgi:methionyl-tRNA formyltransferase
VQHAILRGDEVTGASTFRIVAELDAGPVFGVVTEPIRPSDTAGDLLARLAASGAELLVATMDGIESGELTARPQPPDGVSLAPKITSEDARVRWTEPALAVSRLVRACTPAPGAWTELNGTRLKLGPFAGIVTDDHDGALDRGEAHPPGRGEAHPPGRGEAHPPGRGEAHFLGPGELCVRGSRVLVGTGTQPVQLGDVQPHGKRQMPATDWARGLRLGTEGAVLA